MREFQYVITDPDGIHARPAGGLVKEAKKYTCEIRMIRGGKEGDCRKLFAIMGLAVKAGDEITMTFHGADEDEACEALAAYMREYL